jgi:class 3 adenylate cyclase
VDKKKFGAYLLLAFAAIKFVADAAIILAIGGLLVLFGLQFPHTAKWDSLWLVERLHLWGDPALAGVASKFGWAWPSSGISLVPIGGGFVLLAVKVGFDAVMLRITRFVQKRLPLPEETLALSASASSQGISVSSTLLALAAVSDKAMAKIRRRYSRVENRLAATKPRWCAFLSVGVVDAEEMKRDTDSEKVANSFKAFEGMLEEVFQVTGAWKEAWTPDGVMVCYLDIHHAVDAGQRVLKGLEGFNHNLNELAHPFRACCGVNEGDVIIFEDSKLQKVADRVIDVAGHMQKKARPNCLWLSSEVYDRLEDKSGFYPAMAQVDGFTVLEWSFPDPVRSSKSAA